METRLRPLLCALLLIVAWVSTAPGHAQPFRAGCTRITVQDTEPFDVFYHSCTGIAAALPHGRCSRCQVGL